MDGCRVGVEDREVASKNYSNFFPSETFFFFSFFLSILFFFKAGSHGAEAGLKLSVRLNLPGNS